jgi:hypothetical protein
MFLGHVTSTFQYFTIPIIIEYILPSAPGELQMETETEGCLYPCGEAISARVAVNSIPPEP